MSFIILITGILVIIEGLSIMVWPASYRKAVDFFLKGKMIYLAAIIKIALGAVFLMAVRDCRQGWRWVIFLIGLMMCMGSTAAFFIKFEKLKLLLGWLQRRSNFFYRLLALFATALGGIIAYAA